jgi:hypothetical protein
MNDLPTFVAGLGVIISISLFMFLAFAMPAYFGIRLAGNLLITFPICMSVAAGCATYLVSKDFRRAAAASGILMGVFFAIAFL